MPELPEVETIRLGLSKKITGLKITKIENISGGKSFEFSQNLRGRKVLKVWRKAKVLGLDLDNGLSLLFHLKMTGQLILVGDRVRGVGDRMIGGHPSLDMFGELPNKSTRVIFTFNDGSQLYFNDQRKFGWVRVLKNEELRMMNEEGGMLAKLGPEPLEKEFTWQILRQNLLKHPSMAVKVVLLDQSVVSGIGNIYACEACFLAKIDPRKKVKDLKETEFRRLHQGIVESLKNGIKYGGSSKTHFVNTEGKKGKFLDHAFVYNREGDICKLCGGRISKIKLGGRGTYFCPKCQKSQD